MIVFLDFDGVLHPRIGSPAFLPRCMEALAMALRDFEIEIVVSSSWLQTNHLPELEAFLAPLGKPVVGVTPKYVSILHSRYNEILQFLKNTGRRDESWLAIDDDPGLFPGDAPVYITNPLSGFQESDVLGVRALLEVRDDKRSEGW
ncbi:HAD domain-containing protein [Sedimenticola selenatireducens]|nr:HAD domain-containing protein [Sedimenticola selenatireducens]